ncbi:LysR substrate-binding domain-containing protein [Neorhizobium sp. CSC1952]|uniref:LysR substrate-binding domain-containing protein n=1 Tax=Neorhizobium sp. CSC1952 TaxID=2978974 RepID=UPI0025A681E4|nr:LysR substrate-binding domain-containing protein [Rhizobium sp. CSC1952]WJR66374.1 LysR substrate-binding domain-containing protein [Rhizobium sp. CSC1952]
MLDLRDIYYFVQIVDRGGFTAAGNFLRLPKSTLSHRMRELEVNLGVRLLNRTSRQFGMTEVGTEFYRYATQVLREADLAEQAVRQRVSEPSGTIRITTAVEIAQFALKHLLPTFLNKYPKVRIVEITTDRLIDIVGEGFDLALRGHVTPLQDSGLVQRAIARVPWCLFASPGYLKDKGTPIAPEDLVRHETISMVGRTTGVWKLQNGDGTMLEIAVDPRFLSNNMVALKEAACADLGIAALPGYICKDELADRRLVQLMPGWITADARMSAVMPHREGLPPAVRALVDFLAAEIPKITEFSEDAVRW